MKTIYIASDHRGFELKDKIATWLKEEEYRVEDLGAHSLDTNDDYPDYGIALGNKVASDTGSFGIGLCGSGIGIGIAANKVPGVRAGNTHDIKLVEKGRSDDDINVLTLGADYITFEQAKVLINVFIKTDFAEKERYKRRISKINEYDKH